MEQENELGVKPVKKLLWKLAIPAITAQIVNVLYNVVDRIYIGHIPEVGKLALTGVGVCMPLIMLISAFAMLAGMGGAPRASIMLGRNDAEEAERILGNCAALLILVAVTLTVLFQLFAKPFLLTFGASRNTIGFAMDYIRIYACGTIFVQLTLGLNAFITAQGFAKISMKTTLIGAVTNIILDPAYEREKMGADLPAGKANHAEIKAEKFPLAGKGYSPLCAAGVKPLCDAVYGKYSEYLL